MQLKMATHNDLWLMPEKDVGKLISRDKAIDVNSLASTKDLYAGEDTTIRNNNAIIRISGSMSKEENFMSWIFGMATYDSIARQVELVASRDDVKQIILELNTNGGMVAGLSDLSEVILNAKKSKPVIAYVTDACYSAGYYIASLCDGIFSSPTGSVGSIGSLVMIDTSSDGEYKIIRSKNAKNKALDVNDEGFEAQIQELVDNAEEDFLNTISKNRGVSVEHIIENYGNGSIFTSKKALEKGMIDGISSLNKLLQNDLKDTKIVNINKREVVMNDTTPQAPLDADKIRQEAIAQERSRVGAIGAINGANKMPSLVNSLTQEGVSAELSQKLIEAVLKDFENIKPVSAEEKKEPTALNKLGELMGKEENNPSIKAGGENKPKSNQELLNDPAFIEQVKANINKQVVV